MWKILTAEIKEDIYYTLFLKEQKGCHKVTRGTGDLLYIDQHMLKKKIRTLRKKETYKYLGILEADTTKQAEMKEKTTQNQTI